MTMTFPLAEAIIAETPLQDLVVSDQVTASLCGYTKFVPNEVGILTALHHGGYRTVHKTDEVFTVAVELVEERLERLSD